MNDNYILECWRPYCGIKEIYSKKINGIVHRIFPSVRIDIGRFSSEDYSYKMINELRKESKKNKILIHLQGHHGNIPYTIASKLAHLPIVASHLGFMSTIVIIFYKSK